MKRIIFLSIVFVLINAACAFGQSQKNAFLIGVTPSLTVEPFYEKGELDINIFPLVYQKTITNRIDFRGSTILNYGIRKSTDMISHFGGEIAFPVFLKKKDDLSLPSEGFYCAPGAGIARNRIENHTNIGFEIEPGYNLLITQKCTITFGIQLGATYFDYDDGTQKWGNHFGMTIIFGRWL